MGFPWWLSGKESTWNEGGAGAARSIPGLRSSPEGGHGNPLQYSCLENPTDRGAWQATVHGVAKSRSRLKQLSTQHPSFYPWNVNTTAEEQVELSGDPNAHTL